MCVCVRALPDNNMRSNSNCNDDDDRQTHLLTRSGTVSPSPFLEEHLLMTLRYQASQHISLGHMLLCARYYSFHIRTTLADIRLFSGRHRSLNAGVGWNSLQLYNLICVRCLLLWILTFISCETWVQYIRSGYLLLYIRGQCLKSYRESLANVSDVSMNP